MTRVVLDLDRLGVILDQRERRQLARAGVERRHQEPVLDIVAEGRKPDLARRKADLRRPQQPRGGVDDPHHAQRRRLLPAARPDAERVEWR